MLSFMLLIGPIVMRHGWRGIRDKRIVSKGREYTGTAAVIVGGLSVLAGVILIGGALLVGGMLLTAGPSRK